MTSNQVIFGCVIWIVLIGIVYSHVGWANIRDCYKMWLTKDYWTDYNIVEGISWLTKAIIIVPGLIFQVQLWWLYFVTLITSLALVWASNRKLLPTLVGFNTIWTWISAMVLAQNLL